jgi:hypothetical protein
VPTPTATPTATPTPVPPALYLALAADGTVGGVPAANEDILTWDGAAGFALYFDGSDVGLGTFAIDALARISSTELLLSFSAAGSVPGIAGTVDDSDIVRFTATSLGTSTAGTFTMYFDASDVGLSTNAEDVDAVELLSNGHLLISTSGAFTVAGVSGADEDVIEFTPSSLGAATSGTWAMYFDGSDVGLADTGEDIDGVALHASGALYLSASDAFSVPGVSGADEDVCIFTPATLGPSTSGSYSPLLFFDGSAHSLAANDVAAIEIP